MSATGMDLRAVSLVMGSVVLSAVAQLLFRFGMMHLDMSESVPMAMRVQMGLDWLLSVFGGAVTVGILAYGVSVICWLMVLRRLALSQAYPLLSLSYVLVYLGAVYWPGLGEEPSAIRVAGIGLIMIGVVLVSVQRAPLLTKHKENRFDKTV